MRSMKVEVFFASTLIALRQVLILGISDITSQFTYFLNDSVEELYKKQVKIDKSI